MTGVVSYSMLLKRDWKMLLVTCRSTTKVKWSNNFLGELSKHTSLLQPIVIVALLQHTRHHVHMCFFSKQKISIEVFAVDLFHQRYHNSASDNSTFLSEQFNVEREDEDDVAETSDYENV